MDRRDVSISTFLGIGILFVLLTGISNFGLASPPPCDTGDYHPIGARLADYYFNEGTGTSTVDSSARTDGSPNYNLVKTGTLYGDDINSMWGVNERDNHPNGPLANLNANLYFDGDADYVQVPRHIDFDIGDGDYGFVVSAIINVDSSCTKEYLMICGQYQRYADPLNPNDRSYDYTYGWTFYLTNGNLRFSAYNGQGDIYPSEKEEVGDWNGDDLRDSTWHFVACEYVNGYYNLYIDPTNANLNCVISQSSNLKPGALTTNNGVSDFSTTDFFIGRRDCYWDYDKDFEGSIDNVHIYEIDDPQNSVYRMFGGDNVAYWPLDEKVGPADGTGHIENDRVDFDYNHYGEEFYCVWIPGGFVNHMLEFMGGALSGSGNSWVRIYDHPTYNLDFAANEGQESLYIEFYFYSHTDRYMTLISKKDSPTLNGYQIYINSNSGLTFDLYNNGVTRGLSTSSNVISPGVPYHVWAWVYQGTMYLHIDTLGGTTVHATTSRASAGIGATSTDLAFGVWITDASYFDGYMDEVIVSNCYPG